MRFLNKFCSSISIVLLLTIVLIGCSSNTNGSGGTNESGSNTGNEGSGEGASQVKLEILSWWTAGGEADALNAVLDGFHAANPDIKVENAAVAGGAGSNAQTVLSARLAGGEPPAIFQAQGGPDLLRWQEAEYLDSMTALYDEFGWKDVIPEELLQMNMKDNEIYGLPINIHRNNVIWYNKKLFDENGLQAPTTYDEFFAAADVLKAKGITPLALGDKNPRWSTLVLETVLLNQLGADGISELWTGNADFDTPEIREALSTYQKMLTYTNDNHSALDWQDAAELIVSGDAAMMIMGDWASGFFASKNMEPNVDYGWISTPSGEKIFNVVNDSMGMPKDFTDKEAAKKLIEYFGSVEGQKTFNKLKGSIPARTDVDVSDYSVYSQSAAQDFKESRIVLSLAGGSATPAAFINKFDEAVNMFTYQQDADALIATLNQARSILTGN